MHENICFYCVRSWNRSCEFDRKNENAGSVIICNGFVREGLSS